MTRIETKNDDLPIHIFERDSSYKIADMFSILIVSVILCGLAFALVTQDGMGVSLIMIIPMSLFCIWAMIASNTQKLFIYQEGIEHHYGSRRSFVPWEDLDYFERRPGNQKRFCGIKTVNAIHDEIDGGVIMQLLHPRLNNYFLDLAKIVDFPLKSEGIFQKKIDLDELQETKFGQVMYDYAPHLFDEKRKR